jgi:hypothetical protein
MMDEENIPEGSGEKTPPASHGNRSSQYSNSIPGMNTEDENEVYKLARRITGSSTVSGPNQSLRNPFLDSSDPATNPLSEKFNLKTWLQTLMALAIREQGEVPRHNLGVAFRSLSVYGFGSPTDYQKDFANTLLEGPAFVRKLLGKSHQRKINILRDMDGLVKRGEMLVVLGRPGRYVCTHPYKRGL